MGTEEMHFIITGTILDDQNHLTLADISRACAVHAERIIELVDEGVLVPVSLESELRFTGFHLRRARVAIRLQQDLGINLAGVALAIQLLEELETLRSRLGGSESE